MTLSEGRGMDKERDQSIVALFARIDRERRERGVKPLSEEEAMRLANEELHAMRRERREKEAGPPDHS
jgi:hypothetical protein